MTVFSGGADNTVRMWNPTQVAKILHQCLQRFRHLRYFINTAEQFTHKLSTYLLASFSHFHSDLILDIYYVLFCFI
jgi:WD40 repeat protein